VTFAGADESALFQRLDGIAIRRQRAYFFIVFQMPQNWIAAERISFKLVSVFDVRKQVLFDLSEFGHEISSFFLRHFSRLSVLGSSLDLAEPECRRLGSTADPIPLPKLKPRAVREHFIVPAIGSRDVACTEWPYIRRFEHFL
jgi:hypothetical protein